MTEEERLIEEALARYAGELVCKDTQKYDKVINLLIALRVGTNKIYNEENLK